MKNLTKEQLEQINEYLIRLSKLLGSGETYCFDNEYDLMEAVEIEKFMKNLNQ